MFKEYNYGYFYAYCKGNRQMFRGFISKTTKRNLICRDFINDFDGGWPIWIQFVQDDLFITCFDAHVLRRYFNELKKRSAVKEWGKFREKSGQFCSIIEGLNDTDNPVLVLMMPKEF